MNEDRKTVIALLVASVFALITGPVIILMGALSVNPSFIGGALTIIGAVGLFAGMKALERNS